MNPTSCISSFICFTERISDERIQELITSPTKLKEFMIESEPIMNQQNVDTLLHRLMSISDYVNSLHTNTLKRKHSTSPLPEAKRPKLNHINDNDETFPSMEPNKSIIKLSPSISPDVLDDAQSDNSHSTASSSHTVAADSNSHNSSNMASSTAQIIFNNLLILNKMHGLIENGKKFNPYLKTMSPKNPFEYRKEANPKKKRNIYNREFTVSGILRIDRIQDYPHFEVKWRGYKERTWEPLEHLMDDQLLWDYLADQLNSDSSAIIVVIEKCIETIRYLPNLSETEGFDKLKIFNQYLLQSDLILLSLLDKNKKQKTKDYEKIFKRAVVQLQLLPLHNRRVTQLYKMMEWQKRINAIDKGGNIAVENDIDFVLPPLDFIYINEVLPTDGITIPDDPPIGCECGPGGCNREAKCCGRAAGSRMAYSKYKTLIASSGTAVYECNKRCTCDATCQNRVVQHGRNSSLGIFRTANGTGWGIQAKRNIKKGQYICEYVGELIRSEESERRGKIYDAAGITYLFDLDFNTNDDNPYSIDAGKYGNVSHFINHSCDPNAGVWAVWINCLEPDLPSVCLFALKDIKAGEEITFDYSKSNNFLHETSETTNNITTGRAPCLCDAKNCRKVLF